MATIQEQISRLQNYLPQLSGNDKNFAESLCNQWKVKRRLSESQQEWVDKLIQRGIDNFERAEAAKNAPATTPTRITHNVGPLLKRFDVAHQAGIESATIRTYLPVVGGLKEKVTLGKRKADSFIHIRVDSHYFGKVDASGNLIPYPNDRIFSAPLLELIRGIAENPSAAGKVHGQKHGYCMFCGRGLLTTDSVFYGYGPICAEKWGLEWGIARERIQEAKEEKDEARFADAFASVMGTSGFKCD